MFLGWTGVNERTFIAVKPDGVQRRLVGEIVRRFERRGFKLVGLKLVQVFGLSVFLFFLHTPFFPKMVQINNHG